MSKRVETLSKCNGSPTIPRLYRLLPLFHQRILTNNTTPAEPNKENHQMALGRTLTKGI